MAITSTARPFVSALRFSFPSLLLLAALLTLDPAPAAAACTGCTQPSFGPGARQFPAFAAAVVADFNGDGIPDLATSVSYDAYGSPFALAISLGSGDGSMVETARVPITGTVFLASGDFDGDGRADLLALQQSYGFSGLIGQVFLFRGDGAGGLAAPVSIASFFSSGAGLVVADFDGDGRPDFAVGDGAGISLFRNAGAGSFHPPVSIPLDSTVFGLATGDLDSDGRPDLVAAQQSGGIVTLLNAGGGAFVLRPATPPGFTNPNTVLLADVDGDGVLDLVVISNSYLLSISSGNGDGSFGSPAAVPVDGLGSVLAAGDFNGDGLADLAVSGRNGIVVLITDAYGVPQPAKALPGFPRALAIADFDGDGRVDVAGTGVLYLGNGDGSFEAPLVLDADISVPSTVSSADVDGDGSLDLVWTTYGAFAVRRGDGSGGFSAPIVSTLAFNLGSEVTFVDVTGDGRADALGTSFSNGSQLFVSAGDASGHFGVPVMTALASFPASPPAVADFDGDGRRDAALVEDGRIVVHLGDGSGGFPVAKAPSAIALAAGRLLVVDLDANGGPDIVAVGGFPSLLTPLLNDGHAVFRPAAPVTVGDAFAIADFDGDGYPDFVTLRNSTLSFLKGDGLGGFLDAVDSPAVRASRIFVLDADGDGTPDLLLDSIPTTILRGLGNGLFVVSGSLAFPGFPSVAADFTGDGKTDLAGALSNGLWFERNTRCEPRRLRVDPVAAACAAAGSPLPNQPVVRVVDDGGNVVTCEARSVAAALVAPAGSLANLVGTSTAPVTSGAAHFSNLGVDLPGGPYRISFALAGVRAGATAAFSLSLAAPAISGPSQTCAGEASRFTGPSGPDSWTWALDGTTVGSARILTLPPLAAGLHTLALTVRQNACIAAKSLPITVAAALPDPSPSSNGPVPFGGTLQLHAASVPGGTFRWSGPNGFSANVQNPTVPFATTAATGRYSVTVSVGPCTSAPSSVDVVVLAQACSGCASPSFAPAPRAFAVPDGLVGIALADADADGIPDIVSLHADGTVSFRKGDGRGGFAPAVVSSVGVATPAEMTLADLDGNGLPDVVARTSSGFVVALQTAPGSFGSGVLYPTSAPGVSAIAVADLDGDGALDVITVNAGANTVSVLLGSGTGTFGDRRDLLVGLSPSSVAVGDVDGDHIQDLLVANAVGMTVTVLRGTGGGTFSLGTAVSIPGNPKAIALGDVVGDASLDLVTAYDTPFGHFIALYQGTGAGTFAFVRSFAVESPGPLSLADADGDGRMDLVVPIYGGVWYARGLGAGDFAPPVVFPFGESGCGPAPGVIAFGDANGDGTPDMLVGTGNASCNTGYYRASRAVVLSGDGAGGFGIAPALGLPIPTNADGLASADLNGDGRSDLLVLDPSYPPRILAYTADGTGEFVRTSALAAPSGTISGFVVGDVDGDGLPDVVAAISNGNSVHVFRGLGDGTFAPPVTTTFAGNATVLASGDVNGDGRMDIVLGAGSFGFPSSVALATSSGHFGIPVVAQGSETVWRIIVADLNRDGRGEVIAANQTAPNVLVWSWAGSAFSTPATIALDSYPQALAAGDFDGDGNADVVASINPGYAPSAGYGMRLLPGNGTGGFAAPRSFGPAHAISALIPVDINGDGFLDLAAVSRSASTVMVYAGDGTSFFSPVEYALGMPMDSLVAGDFRKTGRRDLVAGMSKAVRIMSNTNCVPGRLGVMSNPACVLPGQPLSFDVGVFDDGGNRVACNPATVTAALVPGTGAPGAVLGGTTGAATAGGTAHFGNLTVDRSGRKFALDFTHPLASPARSAPFSVGAPAVPVIAGPAALCAGTSTWTAPGGYDSYTWSIDGNRISSARSVMPVFQPAGSHTLELLVTQDRCAARSTMTITNAPPRLDALSPSRGPTQGGTRVSLASACVAGGAMLDLGGATMPVWPPTPIFFTSPHAPGVVGATLTNPDGQSSTLAGAFTYECDTRPPAILANAPVCSGSTLTLEAPFFSGATYTWTGPSGFTANTRVASLPGVSLAASGVYTLVVSGVYGCTLPAATHSVTVSPTPSATITLPASVVAGSTGNVASVPDAGPGAIYDWFALTGATITSGWNTPSVTFKAAVAGVVTIGASVWLPSSCGQSRSATTSIVPAATRLSAVTPCRLVDTRRPEFQPAVSAGSIRTFPVGSVCGVPADAVAVTLNVTVTSAASAGALRVFASGTPAPATQSVSFSAGRTRASAAIVMLGPDGQVSVLTTQTSGTVHVILDVSGYFK